MGTPEVTVSEVVVEEEATEAVLEFLGDTKVGCRTPGMARAGKGEASSVGQESESEEGGLLPP